MSNFNFVTDICIFINIKNLTKTLESDWTKGPLYGDKRGYTVEVNPKELERQLKLCFFIILLILTWSVDFWNRELRELLHTTIEGRRKFNVDIFCFLINFVTKREWLLKPKTLVLSGLNFLDYFDFAGYYSEVRKRYTLKLLLMCLEIGFVSISAWVKINNIGEDFAW